MKHISFFILTFFLGLSIFAQDKTEDSITGNWYNQEKDAVIEIYKSNDSFQGKIIWMKFPNNPDGTPKTDNLNPDEKLQKRERMGMVIMNGFKHDEDNVWNDGEIYDPKSGNTYSGTITLTSSNKLDLRGYVGLPIFGRTSSWTRKLD
jgi:uncharacterized protein (DUF2147 family)